MKTPLHPSEHIVKSGVANLQHGIESVGGKLHLTNQRLVFESHRFNLQTGATIIPRASIVGVQKCWTKFLNLIPMLPNAIAVSTNRNEKFCLVVGNRKEWMTALIEQQS